MPRFWTPAGHEQVQGITGSNRRANKSFEPGLTGMAWTASRLYLVFATHAADYEHVAKLIYCRILMRDDPDYAEQHGKHISALILCDDAPRAVLDFASRTRVGIVTERTPGDPLVAPTNCPVS
jgi:hypothetical protein